MSEDEILSSVTPDLLRDLLQDAGCRVMIAAPSANAPSGSPPVLRSATNGLAFEIRFTDPVSQDAARFAGFALMAGLMVQGDLPSALISRWNAERRFARLFLQTNMLILAQDVTLAGGVGRDHLRAQIILWDRLVQDLLHYLRGELAKVSQSLSNLPAGSTA
jgi:hypothetical protein